MKSLTKKIADFATGRTKLNSQGVAHHFLIAIVAITFVASFGAYRVFFSKAGPAPLDSNTTVKPKDQNPSKLNADQKCNLRGLVAENGKCLQKCGFKDGNKVINKTYCEKNISKGIGESKCKNELHRRYVKEAGGCARKANQKSGYGAIQCAPGYHYYKKTNTSDECWRTKTIKSTTAGNSYPKKCVNQRTYTKQLWEECKKVYKDVAEQYSNILYICSNAGFGGRCYQVTDSMNSGQLDKIKMNDAISSARTTKGAREWEFWRTVCSSANSSYRRYFENVGDFNVNGNDKDKPFYYQYGDGKGVDRSDSTKVNDTVSCIRPH